MDHRDNDRWTMTFLLFCIIILVAYSIDKENHREEVKSRMQQQIDTLSHALDALSATSQQCNSQLAALTDFSNRTASEPNPGWWDDWYPY